jgi:hypothetical protein
MKINYVNLMSAVVVLLAACDKKDPLSGKLAQEEKASAPVGSNDWTGRADTKKSKKSKNDKAPLKSSKVLAEEAKRIAKEPVDDKQVKKFEKLHKVIDDNKEERKNKKAIEEQEQQKKFHDELRDKDNLYPSAEQNMRRNGSLHPTTSISGENLNKYRRKRREVKQ